jgi:hypothetical protein
MMWILLIAKDNGTVCIIAINPFDYYSPTVVQENPHQCRKLIFPRVAEQDSFSRSLVALGKIEIEHFPTSALK